MSNAIRKARLVVLATGTGEGTLWEFTEVVRLMPPERLLVTVFTDEREYDRFRSAAEAAFAARAAGLQSEEARRLTAFRWPAYPPLKKPDAITRVVGARGTSSSAPTGRRSSSGWTPPPCGPSPLPGATTR